MAERRMFAKTIIDSDAFLDMPHSSQNLYFHLSMRADDDGFINNPKSIMRNTRCNDDDMKLLITKKFIIPFESGIVVIKHWKIHNYIAKDRYNETKYKEEKATLMLDENKAYTACIQPVHELATQDRLGKDSIGKDSLGENNTPETDVSAAKKGKRTKKAKAFSDDVALNNAILEFKEFRKQLKKPMTDNAVDRLIKRLQGMTDSIPEQIEILNQSIDKGWLDIYPLKGGKPQMVTGGRNAPTAADDPNIKDKMERLQKIIDAI